MNGPTLFVQEGLGRDPHAGDLFVFRGRRGHMVKILWHDGWPLACAKRLEHARFIWPTPADGPVAISAAQLGYLLDGINWRNPPRTWRPAAAGWPTPASPGVSAAKRRARGVASPDCDYR